MNRKGCRPFPWNERGFGPHHEGRLIIVTLIAIVVAIAIPQLGPYKTRSRDSSAESELRNKRDCADAYLYDRQEYPATQKELFGVSELCGQMKPDMVFTYERPEKEQYIMTAHHEHGSKEYRARSQVAGIEFRLLGSGGEWVQ